MKWLFVVFVMFFAMVVFMTFQATATNDGISGTDQPMVMVILADTSPAPPNLTAATAGKIYGDTTILGGLGTTSTYDAAPAALSMTGSAARLLL